MTAGQHTTRVVDETPVETWGEQGRRLAPVIVLTIVAVGLAVGAVLAMGLARHLDLPNLTRDPAAVTGTHWWVGLLSFLGFALWGIGAGSALAAGLASAGARRRLLLQAAALTVLLLLDDMLMLHENVLPNLHVPEFVVYVGYLLAVTAWAWSNRIEMRRTDRLLLVVALLGFAASIGLDKLIDGITDWTFLEDSLKFGGIALWSLYLVRTSVATFRSGAAQTSTGALSG
jgi:hypothetical protein